MRCAAYAPRIRVETWHNRTMGNESTHANTAVAPGTRLRSATTWDELAALPGFLSEQVPVDKMRRGNVVGQYSMKGSDMRPCGIASCSQPHKHGFIVELVDGTLSHVGRICGKHKLGVEFNQMLVRFRATRKAAAKAHAATAIREEAKAAIAEALKMPSELQAAKALLSTLDSLPPKMKAVLERRAAAGDSQIIRWRDPTPEEVKKAKFMGNPSPTTVSQVIANIDEIRAVAPNSRADFIAEKRIPQAVAQLTAMTTDAATDADAIAAKIQVLRETRDLLDRSIERIARFFAPANVVKLGYLENADAPARVTFDAGPPSRLIVSPPIRKR